MGLLGDIEEVTKDWRKKSLPFKAISLFSLFLAVSSIASLADILITWKGFFKDGIEFYRSFITIPIGKFFGWMNIKLYQGQIDTLVITNLFFLPIIRILILSYREDIKNIYLKSISILLTLLFYLGFLTFMLFSAPSLDHVSNFEVAAWQTLLLVGMIVIYIAVAKELYKSHKIIILLPLAAVAFIFICGAFNRAYYA